MTAVFVLLVFILSASCLNAWPVLGPGLFQSFLEEIKPHDTQSTPRTQVINRLAALWMFGSVVEGLVCVRTSK